MPPETQHQTNRRYFVVFLTLLLLLVFCACFAVGRVLTGQAPWGPKIGGKLPNGIEVYFQARPAGFETDDRLTVISPNSPTKHYWVDQVHGGFEHVVLKYNDTGTQLWVESDGKVGASLDLATNDFRSESDRQHDWAVYGTGTTLDSGNTSSIFSLFSPW